MPGRIPFADKVLGSVAVLCTGVAWIGVSGEYFRWNLIVALMSTGVAALVFVRRVWLIPAFLTTYVLFAGVGVVNLAAPIYLSIQPILVFAPVSLMAVTEYARSMWWGAGALMTAMVGSVASPAVRPDGYRLAIGFHCAVLVAAFLWASRRRAIRLSHEREIEYTATIARSSERAKIAAELHDVLGHTLTVVYAQASTGSVLADRRGESSAEVLRTVAEVAKQSLGDMRYLVTVLREGQDAPGPAASLEDLSDTVDRAQAAGVAVTAELPDRDTVLRWQEQWPVIVRLAVLRVVRESVTNVIRHAGPGATMRVVVRGDVDVCTVAVENTGVVPARFTEGRGLTGLRERVAAVGGTLEVTGTDTGVRLVAQIPLELPDRSR